VRIHPLHLRDSARDLHGLVVVVFGRERVMRRQRQGCEEQSDATRENAQLELEFHLLTDLQTTKGYHPRAKVSTAERRSALVTYGHPARKPGRAISPKSGRLKGKCRGTGNVSANPECFPGQFSRPPRRIGVCCLIQLYHSGSSDERLVYER